MPSWGSHLVPFLQVLQEPHLLSGAPFLTTCYIGAPLAPGDGGPIHLHKHDLLFFLAVLGLCCCARAFSSCGERGLLFGAVCGFLIAVASLVAEHGL